MAETRDPMQLLAQAMKLRAEISADLDKLKKDHASLVLQVGQSAEKVSSKEQELAIRDAEARRLIRELK